MHFRVLKSRLIFFFLNVDFISNQEILRDRIFLFFAASDIQFAFLLKSNKSTDVFSSFDGNNEDCGFKAIRKMTEMESDVIRSTALYAVNSALIRE